MCEVLSDMTCLCYPLTGADLHLLIIAEGTVHDLGHAPTHHVCCTSLMKNNRSIWDLKKKKNGISFSSLSFFPRSLLSNGRRANIKFIVNTDACFKGLSDTM